MAYYRSTKKPASNYWSSPAGRHRRLAKYAFSLASQARSAKNWAASRSATRLGRSALALAKALERLWKRGLGLTRAAYGVRTRMQPATYWR
jgi:hypothetical protein